ncbi:magnesium-translocating P-type ATPase [Candidatus Phytoplasma oryzae]|nr:magnesium-translocating P-type ATPase [Candidatus Phytoplasma oryzae]
MNEKNKKNFSFSFYKKISLQNNKETEKYFQTNLENGLTWQETEKRKKNYGLNILDKKKTEIFKKIIKIIFNPFNIVLFFLILTTFLKDIWFAKEEKNYSTIIVVFVILFISNIIYFIQELKFSKISEKFKKITQTNVSLKRNNKIHEVNSNEVVVGDIIHLSAGDVIPADIKLFENKDFFVKETHLTGEDDPIEKNSLNKEEYKNILEDPKIVFMGTNVVSGYAKGIVILTGNNTYLGQINKMANKNKYFNYQKDINSVSKLLIYSTLFIFPLIFIIHFYKNTLNFDFFNIFLLSLTIILGMTPEMLPLITTLSFLNGVINLSKQKIIIKNLYSIQDLGTMNILFTDKTGTLTENKIKIDQYLDLHNSLNEKVLKYSFLNSFFQTGLKSSIDISIIQEMKEKYFSNFEFYQNNNKKIDEIPFDFERRIISVFIKNKYIKNNFKIISKGAIEEILNICNYAEIIDYKKNIKKLIKINKKEIINKVNFYNKKGLRVIGVAYKDISENDIFNIKKTDIKKIEANMIMIGFLTFFDIPKKSAIEMVDLLKEYNIKTKILTGDNEVLTKNIAYQINIENYQNSLLGSEIDKMNDDLLYQKSLNINVFAKLTPENKSRIVSLFRKKGYIVGFMGDGINDAPAMQSSNLAISVEAGVDIAKETSDVILLDKNLKAIINGILEGRRIYNNIMKYINFTLSSNFSNVLSILLASFYLPFIPLLHIQILFLNLIYDLICVSLPFDNVDSIYLKKSGKWDFKKIINFMLTFGFIALIFDILFWLTLYNFISKNSTFFQSSWFIFSLWTQIINIFVLRTEKIFTKSKISISLLSSVIFSFIITFLIFYIPYISKFLYFTNPFKNKSYILLLFFYSISYFVVLIKTKSLFIKKNKQLL